MGAGVHFGHRTSGWHPKMEPFIFTARGGVHIINLEKTQEQLKEALDYVKDIAARGGVILFVGTKRQARNVIKETAEAVEMPYVTERWLGGTLTNFGEIRKRVKHYLKLKDMQEKGELKKYTKKERLMIGRQIEDMETKFYGIRNMEAKPDVIFVLDIRNEKTAVDEASVTNIPVIAVCDTNVNPAKIKKIIPGNDDAVKSIEMMVQLVGEAVKEGKAEGRKLTNAAAKKTKKTDEELAVAEKSKQDVEELDLQIHDALAAEKQEEKNK